ncbi:MAG: ABC transporter ATP-binding protein [bacterium]
MPVTPLLDVKNLTVRFRNDTQETIAVDTISFSLRRSEILAIVGESGSGKSVTALSILGLIPYPPGRVSAKAITFEDASRGEVQLETLTEKEYQTIRGKSISMIFQEPMTALNPVFTCGDQVSEPIRQHLGLSGKKARQRVLNLFEEVHLPDREKIFRSYPHELSGGQKQRVMIAMAISCDPLLLIADEPTTALDVSVQKTILDLLKRLQQNRKMSILYITHDLGLIPHFAHRAMVMFQGKIVEQGPVDRIFHEPQHPYTRGLLACRPKSDVRLKRLPTVKEFLESGQTTVGSWQSEGKVPVFQEVVSREERKVNHEQLYTRQPVLKVEHISKQFSKRQGWLRPGKTITRAVDDMSFEVYPGETLGIVGESGCGKTTVSRVVLQLIPPTEGRIVYLNEDISRLTYRKRRVLSKDLQIVFQDPYSSLNPRMTIGRALQEPMKVHNLYKNDRKRKERVAELLSKVGLDPEYVSRYPHEFSGGQRQRICIARALAVEPQLVICDEAVSALDVSIQAQILNLLNDLKRELGLTYIFISHDLNVVKYMSDRLIVMKDGKIVEMGDPDEIYLNPKSEYTKMLLDANT